VGLLITSLESDFMRLRLDFIGLGPIFIELGAIFIDFRLVFTEIRCSKHVFEGEIPVFRGQNHDFEG